MGLIHDLGKVLALKGEPQWAVVGDVFVTGCKPSDSVVFGEPRFAVINLSELDTNLRYIVLFTYRPSIVCCLIFNFDV